MNKEDLKVTGHPGRIPTTPIIWPSTAHRANQIQQTKGSAKPQATNVTPSTQPSLATVAPRTTPAQVSRVRVVSKAGSGSKTFTVKFTHPHGDPYFAGANVYLRRAGQEPTLVASGSKSPLTFTAPTSHAPHAIFVTSVGNWGETDVLKSPSHPVRLA